VHPRALNSTVPEKLGNIALKCLNFNPADRYANADELLQALDFDDEPPEDPPDLAALKKGIKLKASGELKEAMQQFEYGLSIRSTSKKTRYNLFFNKGELLGQLGNHKDAAVSFANAWSITENSAVLDQRQKRAQLLRVTAETYRKSGNTFMANRYEKLMKKELTN